MKHTLGSSSLGQVVPVAGNFRNFSERDRRYIVRLRARVRQPERDLEVTVMITNLSRTGCRVESMISLDPTAPVLITYRNFPTVRAQIMWSKTGAHGCKFERAIPDELMQEVIAEA